MKVWKSRFIPHLQNERKRTEGARAPSGVRFVMSPMPRCYSPAFSGAPVEPVREGGCAALGCPGGQEQRPCQTHPARNRLARALTPANRPPGASICISGTRHRRANRPRNSARFRNRGRRIKRDTKSARARRGEKRAPWGGGVRVPSAPARLKRRRRGHLVGRRLT